MREKIIEKKLINEVKKRNGVALKFVSPGLNGMPDRILLFPGGIVAFIEVKAKGKKPRPLQYLWHDKLKTLGLLIYVLDDEKNIEGILDEILTT